MKKKLSTVLDTKVQLSFTAKGNGKLTIPFADESDLQRIITLLDKLNAS